MGKCDSSIDTWKIVETASGERMEGDLKVIGRTWVSRQEGYDNFIARVVKLDVDGRVISKQVARWKLPVWRRVGEKWYCR